MVAGPTPELHLEAEPVVTTPREVRAAFSSTFAHVHRLDDAVLCISEAVTNAVLHAGTPIVVTATQQGAVVRVEIRDGSPMLPVRRQLEGTSTTGRGVHLLDQLTSRWGVEADGTGKVVWLEFEADPAP